VVAPDGGPVGHGVNVRLSPVELVCGEGRQAVEEQVDDDRVNVREEERDLQQRPHVIPLQHYRFLIIGRFVRLAFGDMVGVRVEFVRACYIESLQLGEELD